VQHGGWLFEALEPSGDLFAPGSLDFLRRGDVLRGRRLSNDERSMVRVEFERFFKNLFDRPAQIAGSPQVPPGLHPA